MEYSFPKNERLSGSKSIGRLFAKGQSGFVYPFRYLFSIRNEEINDKVILSDDGVSNEQTKPSVTHSIAMLISIPKHYQKRAYKRNLLKRRTRESLRKNKHCLKKIAAETGNKIDIAFIYSTKNIANYKTIDNAIANIIEEISKRF